MNGRKEYVISLRTSTTREETYKWRLKTWKEPVRNEEHKTEVNNTLEGINIQNASRFFLLEIMLQKDFSTSQVSGNYLHMQIDQELLGTKVLDWWGLAASRDVEVSVLRHHPEPSPLSFFWGGRRGWGTVYLGPLSTVWDQEIKWTKMWNNLNNFMSLYETVWSL